ncbi:MAG: aspartyl-phosphate phosphatase Spo0E family protein [Clostridiaceae bacterium]|nr:aspartyl-phosphate phosphatase Spo0E family protein [Clostridiaceae bacterium]
MHKIRCEALKLQIEASRSMLDKLYKDDQTPYEEIIRLSQQLDILIVNYQRAKQESSEQYMLLDCQQNVVYA